MCEHLLLSESMNTTCVKDNIQYGHHPTSFLKNISIYLLFVCLFNDRYDSHLDSELPGFFYLCIPPRSILDSWEHINCFTTQAFMLSLRIQTGPPVCIASTSTN